MTHKPTKAAPPATEPAQSPAASGKKWSVKLAHEPELVIEAPDQEQAVQAYMRALSVISPGPFDFVVSEVGA